MVGQPLVVPCWWAAGCGGVCLAPVAPESAGELQWWSIFYSLVHGSFSGVGGTRAGAPPPPPLGRAAEVGCVRAVSVHAGVRCCAFVCHVGSWDRPGSGQNSKCLPGPWGAWRNGGLCLAGQNFNFQFKFPELRQRRSSRLSPNKQVCCTRWQEGGPGSPGCRRACSDKLLGRRGRGDAEWLGWGAAVAATN